MKHLILKTERPSVGTPRKGPTQFTQTLNVNERTYVVVQVRTEQARSVAVYLLQDPAVLQSLLEIQRLHPTPVHFGYFPIWGPCLGIDKPRPRDFFEKLDRRSHGSNEMPLHDGFSLNLKSRWRATRLARAGVSVRMPVIGFRLNGVLP